MSFAFGALIEGTEAASQSSAAAAQVLSSAGELARQAANLNEEMNGFLARVRAA